MIFWPITKCRAEKCATLQPRTCVQRVVRALLIYSCPWMLSKSPGLGLPKPHSWQSGKLRFVPEALYHLDVYHLDVYHLDRCTVRDPLNRQWTCTHQGSERLSRAKQWMGCSICWRRRSLERRRNSAQWGDPINGTDEAGLVNRPGPRWTGLGPQKDAETDGLSRQQLFSWAAGPFGFGLRRSLAV